MRAGSRQRVTDGALVDFGAIEPVAPIAGLRTRAVVSERAYRADEIRAIGTNAAVMRAQLTLIHVDAADAITLEAWRASATE